MRLAAADNLHALKGKRPVKPGQRQARPIHRTFRDAPLQAARARQQFELKLIRVIRVKLADRDLGNTR